MKEFYVAIPCLRPGGKPEDFQYAESTARSALARAGVPVETMTLKGIEHDAERGAFWRFVGYKHDA